MKLHEITLNFHSTSDRVVSNMRTRSQGKFFVYFTAPCRVNITKNLIKVYQNGTKPGSDCKEGFGLIGIINSDWPVCFNGTWKFDGKEFYPRCESNRIIEMFDNNYWDKSYSHGG